MSSNVIRNKSNSSSQSRSRSRDKKEKLNNSHFLDYKGKFNYHRKRGRNNSDEEQVKLYLSNLGSNINEKRVSDEFRHYGEVVDISIKRKNGKSNFFGYVIMQNKNAGERAMLKLSEKFGWRITLYDKNKRRERQRENSNSYSNSRSTSKSRFDQDNNKRQNRSQTNSEKMLEENKPIRVREIWVGNLPNSINEQNLYNYFFIYGEIDRIQTHFQTDKNYAFIKYKLSSSASRAYEKAKNMNIGGNVIRVSFSDSGKRRDIRGDLPGYELNEKTCKMLHISLNKNCPLANEIIMRELFSKYGTIKAMHIKNTPGYRPTVYLEYSKPEEAEVALNNLVTLDTNAEKRRIIGDPLCDINYYFKKKIILMQQNMDNMMKRNMLQNNQRVNMNTTNMNTNMNPNLGMQFRYNMGMMNTPQMIYMIQRQQMMNQVNNNSMINNLNTNNEITTNISNSINQNLNGNNVNQLQNSKNNQYWQIQKNMNQTTTSTTIPPIIQRFPYQIKMNRPFMFPNNEMYPQMINSQQNQNTKNNINYQQNNQNVKELIQNALSMIKSQNNTSNNNEEVDDQDISSLPDDNEYEKEFSLEEENLKNIWGGFLTKNKKDRVCVDAYQIRNECSDHLNNEYNLNVSHRTQSDDIMKRPLKGIIAFSPQNATQCNLFQDYINYFNEKNRVGVINLKNQMILYLVPPCEFSRKFYQNPKKHLLGIFVDSKVEPLSYVDMNNLVLPPPVISLTEKRLILKQKKNNNTNGKSSKNLSPNLDKANNLNSSDQEKLELLLKKFNSENSQNINSADLNLLLSNPQFMNLLSNLNK